MLVEESRVESAHGVVRFHSTIHDSCITLLRNTLLGDLWIYPVWETPHAGINLSKLNRGASIVGDCLLEVFVKVAVVQENIWVMVPSVEMALNGLDGLQDTLKLLVSGQNDESSVCLWLSSVWNGTSSNEYLIVLLANPPADLLVANSKVTPEHHIPDLWWRSARGKHAMCWARWMANEEHQNEDQNNTWKQQHNA